MKVHDLYKARKSVVQMAVPLLLMCAPGGASAAGKVINAPDRSGDLSVTSVYGGGSLLLRDAEIGGASTTVESVRVCGSGVGKHADITNAPKVRGKTNVVGGKNIAAGAVEYGC